jgi:short-subunit dehydrogenase
MSLTNKYGSTALIAGASEGIGASFASSLAAEGFNLILIARRAEPLQKLADILADRYKVRVRCMDCDLSDEEAAEKLTETLNGQEIDFLVYNAALSYIGAFLGHPSKGHDQAARLNMITPMKLVHHFGGKMVEKGKGAIVLMSSLAGFQGSGYLATYAATKAFSRVLAESLWYEWKDKGVDVMACCAGATSTPGYNNSKPGKAPLFAPPVQMPDEVVRECLSGLGRMPSLITGRGNRFASFIMQRLLPRRTAVMIMGDNTRKMYGI